jgi:ATP-dependent protease ClpP protease subunit
VNRFIEDFESSSGPIGTIRAAVPKPSTFAPGVLQLSLSGKVGPNEAISLAKVQQKLAGVHFDHLHITLDTIGGDSAEGFLLYDFLRALPAPVSVRVVARCFSAGIDILASASYRLANLEALFLIHPTSRTREEMPERLTTHVLAQASADLARTDTRVVNLLAARTGTDRAFFEKEISSEDPMTAADAIACGLIHEIPGLTPSVDPGWPDLVRSQQFGKIYIDRRLFAPSFLSACRTAGTLYAWDALR